MSKRLIGLAVAVMIVLLSLAVVWDSLRIAADKQQRVAMADDELRKHEHRLVTLLDGSSELTPDVQRAIANYGNAENRQQRHIAYETLVAALRRTMTSAIDPTNTLDRQLMDDLAGAINRRQIAEDSYDKESRDYRQFLGGLRGRLARAFSSQAQADWTVGR
jgi:hypothetical protein